MAEKSPEDLKVEAWEEVVDANCGRQSQEDGEQLSQAMIGSEEAEDQAEDSIVDELADRLNGTKVAPVDSAAILHYIVDALKDRGLVDSAGHLIDKNKPDPE